MPTFVISSTVRQLITFIALAGFVLCLKAQQPLQGEIDYPQLGISFTVPEGWVANEGDGVIFIGSESVSGLILMSIHDLVLQEELLASLESGFSEDGIELFPSGEAAVLRSGVVTMEYTGQIENEPAKGMGIALLNPHGDGVTIVALALEKVYGPALTTAAMSIMESIAFRKVAAKGPSVAHWKKHLTNTRLTRIEVHPAPAAADSTKKEAFHSELRIDLCNGWFTIVEDGHASPMALHPHYTGEWDVVEGPKGKPILLLDHKDGQRTEFQLDEQEGKVYMNGKRWFRTVTGELAPACKR